MGYAILIMTGFIQIGVGVIWWMQTHQIEKTYTQRTELVRGLDGELLHHHFDERFFKEHKIVKKD